jgi:chemotaxis protein methyltransferase CheR
LIYKRTGIALTPSKKVMVAARLAKRLQFFQLQTYGQYYQLLMNGKFANELQVFINILTTNETYFFREPQHFIFFRKDILQYWQGEHFRVWSAASSSGEEAYSLAMVLAETLGYQKWEVLGSDVNTQMLDAARTGLYSMDRLEHMDNALLSKYCLKGVRSQQGYFRVNEKIRNKVRFEQLNLNELIPITIGLFDVIFLRNVLIYFDMKSKQEIVERLLKCLKPNGYFVISHSESLHQVTDRLVMVSPSIFRKP